LVLPQKYLNHSILHYEVKVMKSFIWWAMHVEKTYKVDFRTEIGSFTFNSRNVQPDHIYLDEGIHGIEILGAACKCSIGEYDHEN